MGHGISPLVDYAFKAVLGDPAHSAVTLHFLNAVLAPPRIQAVTYLNPFLPQEAEDDKLAVLDICARDEHGRLLNIEMQTTLEPALPQRLAYYNASLYTGQLGEGEAYHLLRPAITICVLKRALFPESTGLHTEFSLRDEHGKLLTRDLQIHLVELSKAAPAPDNGEQLSPLEQWAQFLLHAGSWTSAELSALLPAAEFREAARVLEMIAQTPEERIAYMLRRKLGHDIATVREEGRREGLQEGLDQGLQEGLEQGRAEAALHAQVALYQKLLGRAQVGLAEFLALSADQRQKLLTDLEAAFQATRS